MPSHQLSSQAAAKMPRYGADFFQKSDLQQSSIFLRLGHGGSPRAQTTNQLAQLPLKDSKILKGFQSSQKVLKDRQGSSIVLKVLQRFLQVLKGPQRFSKILKDSHRSTGSALLAPQYQDSAQQYSKTQQHTCIPHILHWLSDCTYALLYHHDLQYKRCCLQRPYRVLPNGSQSCLLPIVSLTIATFLNFACTICTQCCFCCFLPGWRMSRASNSIQRWYGIGQNPVSAMGLKFQDHFQSANLKPPKSMATQWPLAR